MVPGSRGGKFAVYRIALRTKEGSLSDIVTRGHPELRIEILNRLELSNDTVLIEARAFGPGSTDLVSITKNVPDLVDVGVYPETERSALYRFTIRMPPVLRVLQRHRILTRYPITVVDGWMRFETLALPAQVRALVKDLSREIGPSRIEAVRQGSVSPSTLGLTPSQLIVFRQALASGYFGSPRRISLSELAKRLGRSKSTVSQQIALIQRRLAESALRLKWAPIQFTG